MSRPRLLLLDEPSLGLAPLMVERIFETIAGLKAQRTDDPAGRAERPPRAGRRRSRLRPRDRPGDARRPGGRAAPEPEGRAVVPRRGRGQRVSDYAIQQIVNALSAGSLYALMAVGLAMVFGILRLINFAHGDVMMIAAYIAVFCLGAGLSLEVAIPIMVFGTVGVGLLMERIAYRPIRGAPDVAMLLTSFAVGQILQNGTLLTTRLAGLPTLIAFPSPEQLSGVISIGTILDPQGQRRQLPVRDHPARAADGVRDPDDAGAVDAGRRRGPQRRAADGDQGQPGRRDGVRDRGRAGRRGRASCTRCRPARSTRTWASRRSSRRSSPRSSAASGASPGRCWAATSSASSRSSSRPWPGSATCCRRAPCRPRSAGSCRPGCRARSRATATPSCSSS